MDWWTSAGIALIVIGTLAVFSEIIVIGAVVALGIQAVGWVQTGVWTRYTLASQFHLAPDALLTHWVMVDGLIHDVLFDTEAAVVVFALGLIASPIKALMEHVPAQPPKRMLNIPAQHPKRKDKEAMAPFSRMRSEGERAGSAVGRLGLVLYWASLLVALPLLAVGAFMLVTMPNSHDMPMLVGLSWAAALVVWLIGKSLRFILTGPLPPPATDVPRPPSARQQPLPTTAHSALRLPLVPPESL
jgi:hypothetical protein